MYRVTATGGAIYALRFNSLRAERENIEGLLEQGDHVLLVNDLEEAAEVFDVDVSDIIVVEPD